VHEPEPELSQCVALFGRLAVPAQRSRIVLRDTIAVVVHNSENELSPGVALIGRLAIPTRGSRIILRDPMAVVVHSSEIELSQGVTLIGEKAQKAQRGRIVTALRGGLPILVRPGGDRSSKANGKDERGYRCFQRVFHIHRGCGLDDCPASFGKPTDRTIPIEPIHLPGSSLLSCAT